MDLADNFGEAFRASGFYNFPCFPGTVPDLQQRLANDPKAAPPDKYKVLANVLDWTTNIGYPGYATNAINEIVSTFLLNTLFAKVARNEMTAEDAVRMADRVDLEQCAHVCRLWFLPCRQGFTNP